MTSPYAGLPPSAFWRTAVAEADPAEDAALYGPRHRITPETRIFTAGSCFAQHVTRALRRAGCAVIDAEPMDLDLDAAVKARFGYGLYSARFGNIYTLRQFRQLVEEVIGERAPALPVWERDGRYFDALRPAVEPEGLGSVDAVREARDEHLAAVGRALTEAEVIVFTLGLTECWEHRESGTVYPTAPETVAGTFDPDVFAFRNLNYADCLADFEALKARLVAINHEIRVLLTVSPVPLTATASGHHVLPATAYSKAILRAVAGALVEADPAVDYFPSFELVTAPHPGGHRYEANLRTPTPDAVARVMRCFFRAHGLDPDATAGETAIGDEDDPICDEVLLEAFAE